VVGLSPPRTDVVAGPHGPLEILTRGSGPPGTLFVHGLTGSISSTRPYSGRVRGQRTFMHLAGHGASVSAEALSYEALAQEVWAVAEHVRATAALGISMGAGAILAGLAADPGRFRAVVLVLPAALDRPRPGPAGGRFARLARLVHAADVEAVARHLLSHESPEVRESRQGRQWSREQAERLVAGNPQAALTQIPSRCPCGTPDGWAR